MKIAAIHIYSHDGRRRDLKFNPEGLNIITGLASTGKSSLSDIVEYCMGEPECNIAEGFIREKVSWFAVTFQFPGEQVFVAKPNPKPGQVKCSLAMIRRGANIKVPDFPALRHDGGDELVLETLSTLLGIPETKTSVPEGSSRPSYSVNTKHTVYYLFQKQGLVASKDTLFYRQSEEHIPQAIRDTFSVLFGASDVGQIEAEAKRRAAQRELKIALKALQVAEENENSIDSKGIGLLAEARAVGIPVAVNSNGVSGERALYDALRQVLAWKPGRVSLHGDSVVAQLTERKLQLRAERRRLQDQISAVKRFADGASDFSSEVSEQRSRLESIHSLPKNASGNWRWPFVSEEDARMAGLLSVALLQELESLDRELEAVTSTRPRLEEYSASLIEKMVALTEKIRQVESELTAVISEDEVAEEIEELNNRASRVQGRVSFYMDSAEPVENLPELRRRVEQCRRTLEHWSNIVGDDEDSAARLESILTNVSKTLTEYVGKLEAYFSEYPFRFDVSKLTLIVERPGNPIVLRRTGGGSNHMAYHIAALLALHHYAAENNRPIPRFLMLDQPTQVYFPSQVDYESVGGDVERTQEITIDKDLTAVRRLFETLLKFTQEKVPGFQIIVTEHANLSDKWFQEALAEKPWMNPLALVPLDWPSLL